MGSRPIPAILLALLAASFAQAQSFDLVDLSQALPANAGSSTQDLRDNGTVTGSLVGGGGRQKPVVWRADGSIEVFDGGFYDQRFVRAGNASGTIVGVFPASSVGWVRSGAELRCIPTPFDCETVNSLYLASSGSDINEAGDFVGSQALPLPGGGFRFQAYRGAVSSTGSVETEGLGLLDGAFDTSATAINDTGHVVGHATLDAQTSEQQPLVWVDGQARRLGVPGRNRSPVAVSDSGIVVGVERAAGGGNRFVGLRWNADQPDQPGELLPELPGVLSSRPTDVNDDGAIVGTALVGPGNLDSRGWLLRDGVLTALSDLVASDLPWQILAASAINNRGEVAATAYLAGQSGTRAVLLLPRHGERVFHSGFGDTGDQ